jgi:hypothetical protein
MAAQLKWPRNSNRAQWVRLNFLDRDNKRSKFKLPHYEIALLVGSSNAPLSSKAS